MKCPNCGRERGAVPPGKYQCADCKKPMYVDAFGNALAFEDTAPDTRIAAGRTRIMPNPFAGSMDLSGLLAGTRREIPRGQVLLTAADGFDGYEIMNYCGMAWGVSVRSKDIGQDCAMGCRQVTGGELESYTQLSDESRQRCIDRLLEMALRMNANAVINVRFELSVAPQGGYTLVTAWGTAVVVKPVKNYVPTGALGNIMVELVNTMNRK